MLELTVTAPTSFEARTVAHNWAVVFVKARKIDSVRKQRQANHRLDLRVGQLHDELRRVDAQLVKLMPIVYSGILRYNAPNGNQFTDGVSGPPPVPEQGSTHALNLANERVQLLNTLGELGSESASHRISADHRERRRDADFANAADPGVDHSGDHVAGTRRALGWFALRARCRTPRGPRRPHDS